MRFVRWSRWSFGIEYGPKSLITGEPCYSFQIFNWLPKEERFLGYSYFWYDGPHYTFGLWFTNFAWEQTFFWQNMLEHHWDDH